MTNKRKPSLSERTNIKTKSTELKELPLIPLRDTVIFPQIAAPIIVRRSKSISALNLAVKKNREVIVVAQNDPSTIDPSTEGIKKVGTIAGIRELVKQEDGTLRVLLEGRKRVKLTNITESDFGFKSNFEDFPYLSSSKSERAEALSYSVLNQFRRVIGMGANISFDVLLVVLNTSDPWRLGDLIAANIEFSLSEKQQVLEAETIESKLEIVGHALDRQIKVLEMASKIQAETGRELDKMQREVFLREQLKSIERELENLGGREDDDGLYGKIISAGLPENVSEVALKELRRLKSMPSFSPESSYIRTYLECLCELPWSLGSESKIDLLKSSKILDRDHFGLTKVKERVLEHLAVQKLTGRAGGTIMCFVGPPGTGKTSIGRSIADALGRSFCRLSLGGVRDEAEIRGHRRTYVGAMPGRIIQSLASVGSRNPVFMLDEIDKLGADFHGDPSAALLEVLDPEQNAAFSDHYLEVPFDLSDVLFIATANVLDTIPPALRDRFEEVEFPGYTEREKLEIAKGYLVPKSLKANGLTSDSAPRLSDLTLKNLIEGYTREAGVRKLERKISAVYRKIARAKVERRRLPNTVGPVELESLLGPRHYSRLDALRHDEVGVVNGLAWTEAGGEILTIEATSMSGKGRLVLTGQLGEVMQESAQAALSYVRSMAEKLGLDPDFSGQKDIHLHVPAGAVPKDGPSAGVAMAIALISLLGGCRVDRRVGITGEITLRGRVLEIGGIKEKCLAAHRAGLKRIIMPAQNRRDLVEVPEEVRAELEFIFVSEVSQVLPLVLKPNKQSKLNCSSLGNTLVSQTDKVE